MNDTASLDRIHAHSDGNFPAQIERCRAFLRQKSISASGEGIRDFEKFVATFLDLLGR